MTATMTNREITEKAKIAAREHGADLVGVLGCADLPEHRDDIEEILPGARSVMVMAARHSLSALRSGKNEIAQFDTIHAYGECARAAHAAARALEEEGFRSLAVPAFIPLDMREPKRGMRGEICWRAAATRSGLGSYGENGLLVTRQYGSAVRLAGIVSEAPLEPDAPLREDICDHCMHCVERCPAGALSGGGRIDKKLCGDLVFRYGFRFFRQAVQALAAGDAATIEEIANGHGLRELWQTFMTGNYYYCFACQAQCPAENLPARP